MITRRGFMIAGGSALTALSLAGSAAAYSVQGDSLLIIASPARANALEAHAITHQSLSGDRLQDLAQLEQVLSQGAAEAVDLHLDPADRVLLDIALTRVKTPYQTVASETGVFSFRRPSFSGV